MDLFYHRLHPLHPPLAPVLESILQANAIFSLFSVTTYRPTPFASRDTLSPCTVPQVEIIKIVEIPVLDTIF